MVSRLICWICGTNSCAGQVVSQNPLYYRSPIAIKSTAMKISPVNDQQGYEDIKELQLLGWGFEDIDIVPVNVLHIVAESAGQLLGAYDDAGKMAAFSLGFYAWDQKKKEVFLSSHMVAVHPDLRSQSIGYEIKLAQRADCLNKGIGQMKWTYDPMETRNANLNLRKLGAKIFAFKHNYYGAMKSQLYQGLPSDRYLVTWDMTKEAAPTEFPASPNEIIKYSGSGPILNKDMLMCKNPSYTCALPLNYQEIKRQSMELAAKWQGAIREVSEILLDGQYCISNFRKRDLQVGEYLFEKIKT